MMDKCSGAMPLDLLLQRPMGLLALRGSDGEEDGAKPETEPKNGDEGAKPKDANKEDGEDDDKGEEKPSESATELSRKLANSEEARRRLGTKRDELVEANKNLQKQIDLLKKDGVSDEAVATELKELRTKTETLSTTNQKLALENAFLKDNQYKWINPARALQLADLSEVEITEDGTVHGLKTALDALSKSDPYLLQAVEKDEKKDKEKLDNTGKTPRGGKQNPDSAARTAALRAKYPGLRR